MYTYFFQIEAAIQKKLKPDLYAEVDRNRKEANGRPPSTVQG